MGDVPCFAPCVSHQSVCLCELEAEEKGVTVARQRLKAGKKGKKKNIVDHLKLLKHCKLKAQTKWIKLKARCEQRKWSMLLLSC